MAAESGWGFSKAAACFVGLEEILGNLLLRSVDKIRKSAGRPLSLLVALLEKPGRGQRGT
jgi:hypothetical protein